MWNLILLEMNSDKEHDNDYQSIYGQFVKRSWKTDDFIEEK